MSDRTMPKTDTPNMDEIKFSVSSELLRQVLAIAAIEGLKPAEANRLCWMAGSSVLAEQSNKRLINQKLIAKVTIVDLVEGLPVEQYEGAIAYLKSLKS